MIAHNTDPLAVIKMMPPALDVDDVARLLRQHYGISGELRPLVSERDQNFRVSESNGKRYVLKVANAAEDPLVTRFQIDTLMHIEKQELARQIHVPHIVPTTGGASHVTWRNNDESHVVRLVSWVDGAPMADQHRSEALCRSIGRYMAHIDITLQGFSHAGENPSLLWDMKKAPLLRRLLIHIHDESLRSMVAGALDDFERHAAPGFDALRWQLIHNDLNPENILIHPDRPDEVAGVIDFGDMLRSPLIVDVAVAASYLRPTGEDPLCEIEYLVAAYNDVTALEASEIAILPILIRARLAATVAIRCWRASERSAGDAYLVAAQARESSADRQLGRLERMPTGLAVSRLRKICGL